MSDQAEKLRQLVGADVGSHRCGRCGGSERVNRAGARRPSGIAVRTSRLAAFHERQGRGGYVEPGVEPGDRAGPDGAAGAGRRRRYRAGESRSSGRACARGMTWATCCKAGAACRCGCDRALRTFRWCPERTQPARAWSDLGDGRRAAGRASSKELELRLRLRADRRGLGAGAGSRRCWRRRPTRWSS